MSDLTIIVPVYNVINYLERCLDSILNQTYCNFELILVDDGSYDGSEILCDEYALKDSRITVIHKENGGLSSARNCALEIAKGKYIGFVDSDDYIHPCFYEKLIFCLEENDLDFVKSDFIRFKTTDDILLSEKTSNFETKVFNKFEAINDFINTPFSNTKHMKSTVWDGVYKRELFDNIRFPIGKINEDTYIFLDLIFNSQKIGHINCKYYYYYFNVNGITAYKLNEREINSRDLWKEIHNKLLVHTNEYSEFTAEMWAIRYIKILNKLIKDEKLNKKYYSKIVNELLIDKSYLLKYIKNKKIRNALKIIRFKKIYSFLLKYCAFFIEV